MIGLTEEQPIDLASITDGLDLLTRAAKPSWPSAGDLLARLAWTDAPDPLRSLAALDALGPVRVRAIRDHRGLFVEIRAHRPLDPPAPSEAAAPGSRCGGGWDYYPGE